MGTRDQFLDASNRFLVLIETNLDIEAWESVRCLEVSALRGLVTGLTSAVDPGSVDPAFRERILDGLRHTSKERGVMIVDKALDSLDPDKLIETGEKLLGQIQDQNRKVDNLVLADTLSLGIFTLATIRTTLSVYGANAPKTAEKFTDKLVRTMTWYEEKGAPITVFLTMERGDTLPSLDNLSAFLELMS